jgi:hypothetical protein
MYIKYIQGFRQLSLNAADYDLFLVASATMAAYSLERSYA